VLRAFPCPLGVGLIAGVDVCIGSMVVPPPPPPHPAIKNEKIMRKLIK